MPQDSGDGVSLDGLTNALALGKFVPPVVVYYDVVNLCIR